MDSKDFYDLGRTYLESNAAGICNGALKGETHRRLCLLYISKRLEISTSEADYLQFDGESLYHAVRVSTLPLTDHLDVAIDFPLHKAPNYNKLVPLFASVFLRLATDWFDEQTGLLSDHALKATLERITSTKFNHMMTALDSYMFDFVDGEAEGDKNRGGRFLTMKSQIGQVVTVKPNKFFGCSFEITSPFGG